MSNLIVRLLRNSLGWALLLWCTFSFFVVRAEAQLLTPVQWNIEVRSETGAVRTGRNHNVTVSAEIFPGWYFYSITQPKGGPIRTTIVLPNGQQFRLAGTVKGPTPNIKFDDSFKMNVESYEGTAVFTLPVRAIGRKSGRQLLKIDVRFQACNGEICLSPRTENLEVEVDL